MIRLVQLQSGTTRRVALVEEPSLRLLAASVRSIHALAQRALQEHVSLSALVARSLTARRIPYDPVYTGRSEWRLLPPVDHPDDPACCRVSGTGLTHLGSAKNRNAMHTARVEETDSIRMFRWGVAGGKPPRGRPGVAPEWFHKGDGTILRAPGEALEIPPYAESGGEEGEVAGVYLIGPGGRPWRLGFVVGNEFSDHRFERRNYLNLAGSKIRTCAIGPELVVGAPFRSVSGVVTIRRAGASLWQQPITTGEDEMCHALANIEHHHFKYETHRRSGDLHVHFLGACSLSSAAGVVLRHGDEMIVSFPVLGRPLRNPVRRLREPRRVVAASVFR